MNPTQERAHRLMKEHPTYGARTRLAMARAARGHTDELAEAVADTIDTHRTVDTDDYEGVPAGWQLSAAIDTNMAEPDNDGTYSAHPTGPDSIDRTRWGWHRGSRDYRYWTPGAYTFEDYRRDARDYFGMARHAAWLYAWERVEADERHDRSAHSVPLTVTASRNGIELGSATIWTTRSDEDDYDAHYLADLVADLIPEALEAAEAARVSLTA